MWRGREQDREKHSDKCKLLVMFQFLSWMVASWAVYFIFIYLFFKIYFWLHWVFVAACRLSLVVSMGFSLWWLLLLRSTGSRCTGFSSCGTWAQQLWLRGSRAQAQQLWLTGLVALQHVGSSQTRAQTRVPCIGRRILNRCATREAHGCLFYF